MQEVVCMAVLSKSQMSEEDIKFHYITPAITAKWDKQHITLETKITDGRINLKGSKRQQSYGFPWIAAGYDLRADVGCSVCL